MNEIINLKDKQKQIRSRYLNDINIQLYEARQANNGRIAHNMVQNIIKQSKSIFPWISRNIINKSFKKYHIQRQFQIQSPTISIIDYVHDSERAEVANILTEISTADNTTTSNQRKGGRPKDSTAKKKKFLDLATTAFINEVTVKFAEEKKKQKSRMKKGRFAEIVAEVREVTNIDHSVTISKSTIDRRISRGNLVLKNKKKPHSVSKSDKGTSDTLNEKKQNLNHAISNKKADSDAKSEDLPTTPRKETSTPRSNKKPKTDSVSNKTGISDTPNDTPKEKKHKNVATATNTANDKNEVKTSNTPKS